MRDIVIEISQYLVWGMNKKMLEFYDGLILVFCLGF